jgi:hypothetical protein
MTNGRKLWHTDTEGKYWSGDMHHREPQQLLDECWSTIRDLLRRHPELHCPNAVSSATPAAESSNVDAGEGARPVEGAHPMQRDFNPSPAPL